MVIRLKHFYGITGILLLFYFLAGCSNDNEAVHLPARLLYVEAEGLENQGLFAESITKYEQLITENPGTRLATFSYLRMAEIQSEQGEWVDSEMNYRLFLTLNPNSHITSFVLFRLLMVNHEKSFTGVIFKEKEIDRDMEPNRQLILEYKRFYLLFPQSVYMEEVTPYFLSARETLALRELIVAEFYFNRGQFNAAIGRCQYLLKNYPEFKETKKVLEMLIQAYQENNQPGLAREMTRILDLRYGATGGTAYDKGSRITSSAIIPDKILAYPNPSIISSIQ